MQNIGRYFHRQIFWLDYNDLSDQLPEKDWICLAIANNEPDLDKFEKFVRISISKNIIEFKGHGKFGEKIHDLFDETMVAMEVMEGHKEIEVMTTSHNEETLADAFWQCFFAACLPETSDFENMKVVCTDLDAVNRVEELKDYIKDFEKGWLPPED